MRLEIQNWIERSELGQFLGQNGAFGYRKRADLGTETVEGQGSHLPSLHRLSVEGSPP